LHFLLYSLLHNLLIGAINSIFWTRFASRRTVNIGNWFFMIYFIDIIDWFLLYFSEFLLDLIRLRSKILKERNCTSSESDIMLCVKQVRRSEM
ncbi:hypothetical protein PMAYCL1PPCAC_04997, partial [Pristionchus mayeri]